MSFIGQLNIYLKNEVELLLISAVKTGLMAKVAHTCVAGQQCYDLICHGINDSILLFRQGMKQIIKI